MSSRKRKPSPTSLANLEPGRWKPGESGNPTGTNRHKRLASILRHLMSQKVDANKTVGQAWLEQLLVLTTRDPRYVSVIFEIWNRHDGLLVPPDPIQLDVTALSDDELEKIRTQNRRGGRGGVPPPPGEKQGE